MKLIGLSFVMAALLLAGCQKRVASNDESDTVALVSTPPPTPDYAPPGTFYLLTAVRKETRDGVTRLLPGTEVKQLKNGKYSTPEGEMALDSKNLTNDRTVAHAVQFADQNHQRVSFPKYVSDATAAPMPIAASIRQASANRASLQPIAASQSTSPSAVTDSQLRTLKFRLSSLQSEQQGLQSKASYLVQQMNRNFYRPRSVSTASSDYDMVMAKLRKVEADIRELQSKIDKAEH